MKKTIRIFAISAVIILVAVSFHPSLDPFWDYASSLHENDFDLFDSFASAAEMDDIIISSLKPDQDINISELNEKAMDNGDIDTDGDGLYDSVETIFGTDYNNTDTDFDQLNDYNEVMNRTDPLNPDSNYDGLADYIEIYNMTADIDGDGNDNVWDVDNDDDGVTDGKDLSPFSKSHINNSFNFNIKTNGNPTFLNYQIRPKDSNHLTLPLQFWDWPEDDQGLMRDLNNSEKDIFILPYLEMSIQTDFRIISKNSNKCLEVSNASEDENETIWQNTYVGSSNQHWYIKSVAEGYVKIQAVHSEKCLEVNNASLDDGAPVFQGTYAGEDYQQWKLESLGNNSYILLAKHSGKCLEVYNASMEDNAAVIQSVYSGLPNQIWILEPVRDVIPEQSEIADYGISVVDLNKTLIPLTPIWDYGVVPAFNGRMYYPASATLNLSADVKLLWKVYGRSDTELKALIADNGQMVSANNAGGAVIANGIETGDSETFEWVDLGPDRVALKAHNGKYVGLVTKYIKLIGYLPGGGQYEENIPYKSLEANSSEIGDNETFEIVAVGGNEIALKAENGLFVTTHLVSMWGCIEEQLTASATVIGAAETFTMVDLGYKSDPVPLVSYYEDFMLTGFNIQENYGSSIACFYDTNLNQTIKTGFVMAYEFLRSQNVLSDMPHILQSRNITINSTVDTTLAHQDEAIFKLMSEMLPEALYELHNQSNNTALPFIVAMEDYFTSKTMDEITSSLFIQGFNISIDITNSPVVTSKLFKMNWCNTTNISLLNTEEVLLEAMRWGLAKGFNETDDALLTMMGLFNIWNSGEFTVTNVGEEEINFDIAESPEVLAIIQYSVFSISSIMDVATLITKFSKLAAYRFLVFSAKYIKQLITPLAKAIKTGLKVLKLSKVAQKALTALRVSGRAIKSSNAVKSVIKIFKSARFVSFLDKIGTLLILIDIAITGVIAFYMFWSILFESGFSDFGAALGAWVVIFSFVYAGLYILLALAMPVIGLILAILDMIFDFFGKLLEWFLDLVTKTEIRSEIGLGFVGTPTLETHDYDNNGFDVGDRIDFLARIYGRVWKTSDGYWGDVCDSYVDPSLTLSVPEGSDSGSFKNKVSTVTDGSTFRNETYDMGIWVNPISMSNFPLTIQLTYSYKIYYNQCTWFFGWWCDRESSSGTTTTDITTLHFDVFPGNLSAFLHWNELTPLDSDGDGLSDKEELSSASNPWRVDTDGDGLWDKYEVDRGILPFKSDSDGDGLNDGLEIHLDTEANTTDSDKDGLTDYEEYRGWMVDFNFYGNPFSMHVSPNPLKNDTDDDGLSDLEEFMKGLNPRSNDTDANGILDPDEILFSYQGVIQQVNFNGQGSSIRVMPNSTINADVAFRMIGIECPSTTQPANCSMTVTLENQLGNVSINQTIFQGTPSLNNGTEDIVNFSFNASETEGIYILRYYLNWSCFGIVPALDKREIVGIIDVNISGNGNSPWECYDITGGDTDGDAISNINENIGWLVNYTDSGGTHTIHVTSDYRLIDTDSDGEWDVWEHNCFENSTDPRNPDTDGDGLSDWDEKYRYGTNPLNYDTDGDGLDDQNELIFKSNPFESDSDLDGLTDLEEFTLKSNPNDPDTDNDGLVDLEEFLFNSSLFLPDTDYDTLFDKIEYNLSTDPRDSDTDDDGLIDGYEVLVGTNPKQADTDDDNLTDGDEIYWGTNATCSDTDDDGLIDGNEIHYGTHPFISDTDRDGIKDFDDIDTYTSHVNNIILAYDLDGDVLEFTEHLGTYTNVTIISEDELILDNNYKKSPYLVLVGRIDAGNDTVGNTTKNILENAGENTTQMLDSGRDFFAVKYGVWNKTQTVVMLSHPHRLDHLIVLNILKSMWKSVNGSSVEIQFPTPRQSFRIDAIQEIDTQIWVELNESSTPWMKITKYNTSTTPNEITHTLGLGSTHKALGLYVEINVSENIQNETSNTIDDAWIITYYTSSDLDRTGDGDGNDVGDIEESSLKLYYYHEDTGKWEVISKNIGWVYEIGIDTTNVELYGKSYEGYIWAHVSHFSLYGIAGNSRTSDISWGTSNNPPVANASESDRFGFINSPVIFKGHQSKDDGTIISYVWKFGDGATGSGKQTTHIYSEPGTYAVTLIVVDDDGATDTDIITITIAIANNPPDIPTIDGPTFGNINTEYNYSVVSKDLDNDSIRYVVEWGDGESDTSAFFGNNTLVSMSHSWNVAGVYGVKIYSEDERNTVSGTAFFPVFINVSVELIEDLIKGYLVDNNKDGTYDFFYSNVTGEERNVEKQSDGSYLIDSDGDDNWDYTYDIETKSLIKFSEPTFDYLPLIVAIFVILLLSVALILLKKEKDKKKEKEKQQAKKKKKQSTKKNQ